MDLIVIKWFNKCFSGYKQELLQHIAANVITPFYQMCSHNVMSKNFMHVKTTEFRRHFTGREERYVLKAAFALIVFAKTTDRLHIGEFQETWSHDPDFASLDEETIISLVSFTNCLRAAMQTVETMSFKKEMFMFVATQLSMQPLYTMGSGQNRLTTLREKIIERETGVTQTPRRKRNPLTVLAFAASRLK